ncbi:uncharacterized protein LOC125884859 isoform X2 [Epinephelus fuscoguttatus]|uniref:uncharacterized protein LOC125884859 isoform X2 n=1 Tax=Epinephelus fuscoguttatus TaxID=293821 RepID=UPI0020D0E7D6|nr:uncharacterized protein LOC125884859 isoform X2 [Epinephelus fuscoguttatus]
MVYTCIVKDCGNKPKTWSRVKFHVVPTNNKDRMKQWLFVLDIDPNTPVEMVRKMFVCSKHFLPEDYSERMERRSSGMVQTRFLRDTAIPSVGITKRADVLHDTGAADIQENTPEATGSATREKPALQHIVDEEAILQLIKDCPMCDRRCRCTKFTRGPYFIVYQSCYFCNYQRKWASQPEARDLNIHKAQVTPKRKQQPKDKASGNAKAASSKLVKTRASSVSESQDPIKTKGVPCQLCLEHD